MCKPRWQHRLAWTPLLEQRGQASGWCNVKAKLRWGVFLFSHLFKMLSDHQHLTGSLSRPHEGLWPELALLKVLGWQGVGAAWALGDEMRWDEIGCGYRFYSSDSRLQDHSHPLYQRYLSQTESPPSRQDSIRLDWCLKRARRTLLIPRPRPRFLFWS